jgi:alpha-galactosidase
MDGGAGTSARRNSIRQITTAETRFGFRDVGEVLCDPARARVYEHGWQSWSPTGLYPASATSPRPAEPTANTMTWRPGQPGPATGFQGEGLVAVQAEPEAQVWVFSAPDPRKAVPSIRVRAETARLVVSANGDIAASAYPATIATALGRWAEGLATRVGAVPIGALPPIWCSWYCYWEAIDEAAVLDNLDAMDQLKLPVAVVQIDDGWEAAIGDWLTTSSRFGRLDDLAARIAERRRRAGLWVAPFLVGSASRLADEHPDWLVDGASAGRNWSQELRALDITNPAAAEYLSTVFRTLVGYGFSYFKLDFLYAGALEGGRHADATALDAYRTGLELIRQAVGPEVTLLGCGAPLLPSIGLFDAMRVGPDVARPSDLGGPKMRRALTTGRARQFMHARWWINDPDCLLARPQVHRREEWAAHVEASHGLTASSDPLRELDDWGLQTTRRLLRPSASMPVEPQYEL